jgi:hypothetical protein
MVLVSIVACSDHSQSSTCQIDVSGYETGEWQATPSRTDELAKNEQLNSVFDRFWFDGAKGSATTFWWPERGSTTLHYQFSTATNYTRLRDARFLLLVDGRQVALRDSSGAEVTNVPVRIEPGERGEIEVEIPDEAVSSGAHTLALVVLSERNGDVVHGHIVTAIRGDASFGRYMLDEAEATPSTGAATEVWSDGMAIPVDAPIGTVRPEGALPLSIPMRLIDGLECGGLVPAVATVIVDFDQVALKDLGRAFVRVAIDRNRTAVVDVEAVVPPPDANRHIVSVVAYQGDGMFTEAPPGNFTPWSSISPYAIAFGHY